MLLYTIGGVAARAPIASVALSVAQAQGLHFARVSARDFPLYRRLVPVGVAVVALLFAFAGRHLAHFRVARKLHTTIY